MQCAGASTVHAVDTSSMAETLHDDTGVATEQTCGICLEDSKDPLNLPCGHSFCDGCLDEWRSRYGVEEEMRRKCPICRARIPPSKEMVSMLLLHRANKQELEDRNNTSSNEYHSICQLLMEAEEIVGVDWDGVTVLEDSKENLALLTMPDYIYGAIFKGDIKSALKWINANRSEDRVNAVFKLKLLVVSALQAASTFGHLTLMSLLLQLGANINFQISYGGTAMSLAFATKDSSEMLASDGINETVRLLLSWGASFFSVVSSGCCTREQCVTRARQFGEHELADLLESELGGRRCEIVNLSSRPELNGKTCVVDEYIPDRNQYKVTLENKSKEALVLSSDNLKRRDRTPQDCGYFIEFKNGRTIRHDFDSSEDCQAFVAALNKGEAQPVVTEEAEARAEQAAAELLAELGLDDSPKNKPRSDGQVKKSKKKKGGKKKKKNK